MKNNEYDHCVLSYEIPCDNCKCCEKYGLDISYFEELTEEDICEDEIIEELIYRSEREADLI